jgi:hypothetical protein
MDGAAAVKCPFGDISVVIFSSVELKGGGATPGQGRADTVLYLRAECMSEN